MMRPPSLLRVTAGAAALLASSAGVAAPMQPLHWRLDAGAGSLDRAIGRVVDGIALPAADPLAIAAGANRAVQTAAVHIAPMVGNLLNSRRVASLEETGVPGSGEGYLRGSRRTIGVTLKKPIF